MTVLAVQFLSSPERYLRTFPVQGNTLKASAAFLEERLTAANVPDKEKSRLLVALDEIVSNIIRCSDASGIALEIRFSHNPRSVTVSVSDDGKPFDPLRVPPPDTSLPPGERPVGGLGILLLRKTMDSVSYRYAHSCNILTFIRKL